MVVALFDADGTLYTAQFGFELTKHLLSKGRRWQGYRYIVSVYFQYFLTKIRALDQEKFQRSILSGLNTLMKGCTEEYARNAYQWMLDHAILPTQRTDVIARLREHKAQGHFIMIVSGMTQPALELLQVHLGAEGAIGTLPEIQDGRFTGRTILPAVTGADKAIKVREFLQSRGLEADWPASFAYGDSFTDRQMLSLVGHSVAVYPDKKLFALAKEKGWELFGTPK